MAKIVLFTLARSRTDRAWAIQEPLVRLCIFWAGQRMQLVCVGVALLWQDWNSADVSIDRGAGCNGTSAYIEKYKGDLCCPGGVNLTDVGFDKKAASWQCF